MPTIYARRWKAPSGAARRAFAVEWKDAAGARRKRQFASRVEAKAFADRLARLSPGEAGAERRTIKDACDKFMTLKGQAKLERSTTDAYQRHVDLHIAPRLGDMLVIDFDLGAAETFVAALLATGSIAMAIKVRDTLRQIMDMAVRWRWASFNPIDQANIRNVDRHEGKVEIPTHDEMRAILAAVASPDAMKPFFADAYFNTAAGTGLRPSELRGLVDAQDVLDLRAGPATVTVKQRADAWNKMGPPKSKAGRRTVPIGAELAGKLRRWLVARPKSAMGLVFPTAGGSVQNYSNIYNRVWLPALGRAGLLLASYDPARAAARQPAARGDPEEGKAPRPVPKYAPYALRHYYASLLIDMGKNPKQVQQRMGHASIQITLDTYGHLWKDPRADADEAAEIERRLRG